MPEAGTLGSTAARARGSTSTVIFTIVFLAALASTLLPGMRASRVYPAEALRYE
jgi:ABC-type lipoprotein release transport system permease subunit